MKRKLLSVLLTFCLAFSLLPTAALADEAGEEGTAEGSGQKTYVAQIDDKQQYETLQAAINAATGNATVTLLADRTEDVTINKSIILDLGGKTLTNTNAGKATLTVVAGATATVKNGSIVGGTSFYTIQNNGTATFEDVTATAGNNGSSMIDNYGDLTINSGTYTGGLDTIKNESNAKLTINGGTFTLTKGTSKGFTGVVFNYGELNISGGEFIQSDKSAPYGQAQVIHTDKSGSSAPSTIITGGTFKNLCTKSQEHCLDGPRDQRSGRQHQGFWRYLQQEGFRKLSCGRLYAGQECQWYVFHRSVCGRDRHDGLQDLG